MKEVWKQIDSAPNYMISNYGNVRNTTTGNRIAGSVDIHGYHRYDLCINGKRIVRSGHRLVAEAFIPKVKGKTLINHKDGNKTNNRVDNLEWCTCKENSTHAYSTLGKEACNKKAVRCVETGEIYRSAYEAEQKTGISNSQINRCCNKKRKTTHKQHWEFV